MRLPAVWTVVAQALRRPLHAGTCRKSAADPLDHPDLATMTEQQLADLPCDRCSSEL